MSRELRSPLAWLLLPVTGLVMAFMSPRTSPSVSRHAASRVLPQRRGCRAPCNWSSCRVTARGCRRSSPAASNSESLARALVVEPMLLLLDEPLGALDKSPRQSMQTELRGLQQRLGVTTVIVTHDQDEALTMADRIATMRDGWVEQIGTPSSPCRNRGRSAARLPWRCGRSRLR